MKTKTRINLTIDKDTYASFKKYCEQNGMKISSRVECYMKKELKK